MRQPISRRIELAVSRRAALEGHRYRLGGARHLRGKKRRNRHGRRGLGQYRAVAPLIQVGVLSLIEQIDGQQPSCWIRGQD